MKKLYIHHPKLYWFLVRVRIFIHWASFDKKGCVRILTETLPWQEDYARFRTIKKAKKQGLL
jgi:hypothetical protein